MACNDSHVNSFINHQRLVCWPFKYTFTFRPRFHESKPLDNSSDHFVDMESDDGQLTGDREAFEPDAMLLDE